MKLSCRRCGSSQLLFLTAHQRTLAQTGALCGRCHKPLDAQDWCLPRKAAEDVDDQQPRRPDSATRRRGY